MIKDPPSRDRTVVSVGAIPELLSLRAEILQSAGYEVFTITRPEQAASLIASDNCGVLLLCYSVSDEWRQRLIERFRENCPHGRIVGITNRPVCQIPTDVDELVYGIEGPEALMDAIERRAA